MTLNERKLRQSIRNIQRWSLDSEADIDDILYSIQQECQRILQETGKAPKASQYWDGAPA